MNISSIRNVNNTPFRKEKKTFFSKTLKSAQRIGPHQKQHIDALIGNLLGDGYVERRGPSTRIVLKQSAGKINYLRWLYEMMKKGGICSTNLPPVKSAVGPRGRIYYSCKFATYSFASFNWIHQAFYANCNDAGCLKRVPPEIEIILSARGLAHWIMDTGSPYKYGAARGGLRISTESFSWNDVELLKNTLYKQFSLECGVHRHKIKSSVEKPILYIKKQSVAQLHQLVGHYFHESMLYKLPPSS